jgi:hypothetical protein
MTVTKRYIKPAREGLVVRQPQNGRPLPPEGVSVDWSGYWARRKAEGSIVEAKPPAKPKAKPQGEATKQKEAD